MSRLESDLVGQALMPAMVPPILSIHEQSPNVGPHQRLVRAKDSAHQRPSSRIVPRIL